MRNKTSTRRALVASGSLLASVRQTSFSASCPFLLHGDYQRYCTYMQHAWKQHVSILAVETTLLVSLQIWFIVCPWQMYVFIPSEQTACSLYSQRRCQQPQRHQPPTAEQHDKHTGTQSQWITEWWIYFTCSLESCRFCCTPQYWQRCYRDLKLFLSNWGCSFL